MKYDTFSKKLTIFVYDPIVHADYVISYITNYSYHFSAGPYVQKKCPIYLYLLKAFFQCDFRVPKLKKIERGKILTPLIFQNVTSSFITVSENIFPK